MPSKRKVPKKIINGRMLKNYGSWMYCDSCNKTVGYLCYTTYDYFQFKFVCNCGNRGSFELGVKPAKLKLFDKALRLKKSRLVCPNDQSPLFSIVDKNVSKCSFQVVCKSCSYSFNK